MKREYWVNIFENKFMNLLDTGLICFRVDEAAERANSPLSAYSSYLHTLHRKTDGTSEIINLKMEKSGASK